MRELTETQTIILSAEAKRPENIALPLPKGLAGAAAKVAVTRMIEHGWLQQVDANLRRNEPLWRETGDGHGTTRVLTDAGLPAIGIEQVVVKTRVVRHGGANAGPEAKHPALRTGTKQALLVTMLRRAEGPRCRRLLPRRGGRLTAPVVRGRARWARSWGWRWFLQKIMRGAGCIGSPYRLDPQRPGLRRILATKPTCAP